MSQWKIDPGQVQTVLTNVETARDTLATKSMTEADLTTASDGLSWAPSLTSAVPQAVSAVLTHLSQTNLTQIANRIGAGQLGVANATIAYNAGQEDMAATFQRKMKNSAETGDFTYFEQHGYRE